MINFLEQNSMYVVLSITLIIWIGVFFYLTRLDSRISKVEKLKRYE